MNRHQFIATCLGLATLPLIASRTFGDDKKMPTGIAKITKSDAEWKALLTPAQYNILREEGTERSSSSPLNHEKRKGQYVCVGCALPLFTSDMKLDSTIKYLMCLQLYVAA